MSSFDPASPAQGHQALTDIVNMRGNLIALRDLEASAAAAPPSNPVAGMLWRESDSGITRQRNSANSAYLYLWRESDLPAKTSDVTTHTGSDITSGTTVHGIRQGAGNGFDADKLDGQEGSYYLPATHASAAAGVHGVTGNVVGTANTQTMTNKAFSSGCAVSADLTVNAGVLIGGRDLSVDGAKLDSYPGGGAPADGSVTAIKLASGAVSASKIAKVFTVGTVTLAAGQSWLPSAGLYNVVWVSDYGYSEALAYIVLQIYVSGFWRNASAGAGPLANPIPFAGGLVITNGANVRFIRSTGGSSVTMYYQKLS